MRRLSAASLRAATKTGNEQYGKPIAPRTCATTRAASGAIEAKVDAWVEFVVVEKLSDPYALGWLIGDEDESRQIAQQIAKLQTQVDDAADRFADGKWTATQVDRVNERLLPKIAELARPAAPHPVHARTCSVLAEHDRPEGQRGMGRARPRRRRRKRAVLTALVHPRRGQQGEQARAALQPGRRADVEFGVTR